MKRLAVLPVIGALAFSLSSPAIAHDPPDFLGATWQWPENSLPTMDAHLEDWDIVPPEFWITEADVVNSSTRAWAATGPSDPSNLSFRWVTSFVAGVPRIYWAFEKFDDISWGGESIEGIIDADHTGGGFYTEEGMDEDQAKRNKGRQAQTHHWNFDLGFTEEWSWFWMSAGDWYRDPDWTQQAHRVEGTVGNHQELRTFAEWWQVYWDDYNYLDANSSVPHAFQENEIIGVSVQVHDGDAEHVDDCNCWGRWTLGTSNEGFGNADFLADFILLPVDDSVDFVTAVEDDSWGRVKASLGR